MTKADIVSEIAKVPVLKSTGPGYRRGFYGEHQGFPGAEQQCISPWFRQLHREKRAKKVARNISKNTTITIPAHNIPAFKPAKSFAAKVK